MEQIMYILDLAGTVIFAVTGAVLGVNLRLDLLGVVVFACTVGVGGGMMRDTIIGAVPVAALQNETYLFACIVTGLLVFFYARFFQAEQRLIMFLDAAGLGVFTAIGAAKGAAYGLDFIGIVLTSVFTAVGGGVIRDVMARRIPVVLTSDFYATASLIGGCLFYGLWKMDLPAVWQFVPVMLAVTGLRIAAILLKVRLPVAKI